MDVGVLLGQVLARPIGWVLGGEDDADGPWHEQLREEMCLSEDAEDLSLRHLARAVAWLVLFAIAFTVSALLLVILRIVASPNGAVFAVFEIPVFFVFFMGCVHILKMLIVRYTPERWWLRRHGTSFRLAMLSEIPDFIVAAILAFVVTWSLGQL